MIPIISKKEAKKILGLKGNIRVSLDAGISLAEVFIKDVYAEINNQNIPLEEFKKIKDNSYYFIESSHLKKLAFFSQKSNFYYKL